MQITKTFVVRSAPEAVWAFLIDPRRVAACLPGAAITGQADDATYTGTITVKVGPVSTSYRGKLRFERLDAAGRTAEIVASGQDVRGKGGADLRMTSRLVEPTPGTTEVTVVSEVAVTGMLAQMGRGMIQDVSDQLFQRFTACATSALESAAPPAEGPGEPTAAPEARLSPEPAPGPGPVPPPPPAGDPEPLSVMSFAAPAAGRALGRAARRPATWVIIASLALLTWWLRSR